MRNTKNNQAGILLIEVMIAIVIFSFGILGLVGLQAVASQNSTNAEDRVIASNLSSDIVSQMWLRKTSDVSTGGLAADIAAWKTRVSTSPLTNAVGDVTVTAGIATVSVVWKAPSKRSGENSNRYQTQVVIQ